MFVGILFSQVALKDIFTTLNYSGLWYDLPTSVDDRVISPFGECYFVKELRIFEVYENEILAKNSEFTVQSQ